MKATFYFVAWWKHDEPDYIMAGPFVDQAEALVEASRRRVHDGQRHAHAISATIELQDVELLR